MVSSCAVCPIVEYVRSDLRDSIANPADRRRRRITCASEPVARLARLAESDVEIAATVQYFDDSVHRHLRNLDVRVDKRTMKFSDREEFVTLTQ